MKFVISPLWHSSCILAKETKRAHTFRVTLFNKPRTTHVHTQLRGQTSPVLAGLYVRACMCVRACRSREKGRVAYFDASGAVVFSISDNFCLVLHLEEKPLRPSPSILPPSPSSFLFTSAAGSFAARARARALFVSHHPLATHRRFSPSSPSCRRLSRRCRPRFFAVSARKQCARAVSQHRAIIYFRI